MHYNQVQAKGTFAKMKDERWSFVFELVFYLKSTCLWKVL